MGYSEYISIVLPLVEADNYPITVQATETSGTITLLFDSTNATPTSAGTINSRQIREQTVGTYYAELIIYDNLGYPSETYYATIYITDPTEAEDLRAEYDNDNF